MILLQQHANITYFAFGDKLISYDGTAVETTTLPNIVIPDNLSVGQIEVLQREHRHINCLCVSQDGELILASTLNKQVVVFDKTLKVTKNFILNRTASKVRFTNKNDILIADKTGDAYLYKYSNLESDLILGHLSMLLDILLVDSERYVVTCDRDEKIRVSHYPNCYNIASYCLGHREFVTNIEAVGDVLFSSSGDGTVCAWDYVTGKQLTAIDTNESIKDRNVIEQFCQKMDEDKVEVRALPITDMQVHKVGGKIIIAVNLLDINYIQIYCYENNVFSHVQNICLEDRLVNYNLNDRLLILTNNGLLQYTWHDQFVPLANEDLNKFFNDHKIGFSEHTQDVDVSVLYKRKFDNVQEYLERKKLRLEAK